MRKVYNSLMIFRKRYTRKTITKTRFEKMRAEFLAKTGPAMELLFDMAERLPNVAFTVKNSKGQIIFTNRYNVEVSGWKEVEDMLGYTSEELYPPDQAAVYAGRDREVMESGIPIVERVYGFVADRSDSLNCVTVRPVTGLDGTRVGTATIYWRAQQKMQSANWYNPIRRSIVYLNEHYNENITVEQLAKIAHYSVAQFRKLFRNLTHLSPSNYITQVRVNAAKTLLKTTDRRISDIATEVGFFDHSQFIRTFRNSVGVTPFEYRKSFMASS